MSASDPFQTLMKFVVLADFADCMVSYMVQILRKIPIHPSKMSAGVAPPNSRRRRLAPAVAAMFAFLTLTACGLPPDCEQPLLERVLIGGASVGWSELHRAVSDCPGADELNDLKIKAREGDPDAQAVLGMYYYWRVSPFHEHRELAKRSAAKLMRCAAEGGSLAAQGSILLGFDLEQPDAAKILYKYSKISVQRNECDCDALFQNPPWLSLDRSTNLCFFNLCSSMRDAAEKLSPTQIRELEDEISVYEPSPRPCDVEFLKK